MTRTLSERRQAEQNERRVANDLGAAHDLALDLFCVLSPEGPLPQIPRSTAYHCALLMTCALSEKQISHGPCHGSALHLLHSDGTTCPRLSEVLSVIVVLADDTHFV